MISEEIFNVISYEELEGLFEDCPIYGLED
jgi:hypothetical protein